MDPSRRFFILGSLAELVLALIGMILCGLLVPDALSGFRWRVGDALAGGLAVLPMLLFFFASYHSAWRPLAEIRRCLEEWLHPIIQPWSVGQLLVVSVLAGVGEELLFRGAVQGGLERWVGPWPALVIASLIFGLLHSVTWSYIILATFMGAYLGVLWNYSGNLLAPIVAHVGYDFVALLYLRSRPPAPPIGKREEDSRTSGVD